MVNLASTASCAYRSFPSPLSEIRDIKPFRQGYGNIVYSTPRGILMDFEAKN